MLSEKPEPVACMLTGHGWGKELMFSLEEAQARAVRLSGTFRVDVDPLYSASTVEALLSRVERLEKALKGVIGWASRRCPADDESVPCPLCGARADIPGDTCKAVESIFPRDLLRNARASLQEESHD